MSTTTDGSTFLSNTLRKRHQKRWEAEKILEEGISSLHLSLPVRNTDSLTTHDGIYPLLNINPDSYVLNEGDERFMLEPNSSHDPTFKQTIQLILTWLNTSLSKHSILIRSLEDDLYDGYILCKLIEFYQPDTRLLFNDIPLSEDIRKKTLEHALQYIDRLCLHHNQSIKWNFERIYNRDLVAILHLMLALMKIWNNKLRYDLPRTLVLNVIIVKKINGILQTKFTKEFFIENCQQPLQSISSSHENDLIDILFDLAPDKISIFQKTLLSFVNTHLARHHLEISTIEIKHFQDGLALLYLIAEVESFYLILNKFHQQPPITREQSYENLHLAFDLINKAGGDIDRYCRIDELLSGNERALYRLLFHLYLRYNSDTNSLMQAVSYLQPVHVTADSPLL